MNISLPVIVTLASFALSFASFVLLVVVFYKIGEIKASGRRLFGMEKRAHGKISRRVGEDSEHELDKFVKEASAQVSVEIRKQAESFAKEAAVELKNFSKFLQEEEASLSRETQVVISTAVNKSRQDVEAYKAGEMKQISQKVYAVVVGAAKEVVGKSLNPAEHEELVEKAVEKAKKENFFT